MGPQRNSFALDSGSHSASAGDGPSASSAVDRDAAVRSETALGPGPGHQGGIAPPPRTGGAPMESRPSSFTSLSTASQHGRRAGAIARDNHDSPRVLETGSVRSGSPVSRRGARRIALTWDSQAGGPSTTMVCPEMPLAAAEHNHAHVAATSSGVINRLNALDAASSSSTA